MTSEALWNAQADEFNQWGELSEVEKEAWVASLTPDRTEAERIAKSLTKAMGDAIIGALPYGFGKPLRIVPRHLYSQTIIALERRGLTDHLYRLTSLGEQVRAILSHPDNEKDKG